MTRLNDKILDEESTPYSNDLFRIAFDLGTDPMFILKEGLEVVCSNQRASVFRHTDEVIHHRFGDILCCTFSKLGESGCGSGKYCRRCPFQRKVGELFKNDTEILQMPIEFTVDNDGFPDLRLFEMSARTFNMNGERLVLLTLHEISMHIYKEQLLIAENIQLKQQLEALQLQEDTPTDTDS